MSNYKRSDLVLVRSKEAGVYVGEFVSQEFGVVTLRNVQNIWCWSGANTFLDIAANGIAMEGSKVSEKFPDEVQMMGVCMIAPVSEKAINSVTTPRWK